jgi:hypothetical protein
MEANKLLKVQIDALSASLFLPDYLVDESWSDSGHNFSESLEEF